MEGATFPRFFLSNFKICRDGPLSKEECAEFVGEGEERASHSPDDTLHGRGRTAWRLGLHHVSRTARGVWH